MTLWNPLEKIGVETLPELIPVFIKGLLGILGSIALLFFMWGAFSWLISGGNPEKVKAGKNAMLYSILGLVVVFLAYAIVHIILLSFGL